MPRPHVPAIDIDVANDPRYLSDPESETEMIFHDLDDDEDDIEFEADDRHGGVRRGFDPGAA
jgi:hypothetical protein